METLKKTLLKPLKGNRRQLKKKNSSSNFYIPCKKKKKKSLLVYSSSIKSFFIYLGQQPVYKGLGIRHFQCSAQSCTQLHPHSF